MGKRKRSRSEQQPQGLDQQLKGVLAMEELPPTAKLILASQLWDSQEDGGSLPDYFQKVKPVIEGLDPKEENVEELTALYGEYATKGDAETLAEIKELRAGGMLNKKMAKELTAAPAAERKRHLFVRILIIAEEAEDDDILDGGEDGEEVDTGPEIDEAFIASLKEEDCVEKETMDEKEAIHNLAGWVCGACHTNRAAAPACTVWLSRPPE